MELHRAIFGALYNNNDIIIIVQSSRTFSQSLEKHLDKLYKQRDSIDHLAYQKGTSLHDTMKRWFYMILTLVVWSITIIIIIVVVIIVIVVVDLRLKESLNALARGKQYVTERECHAASLFCARQQSS
jgi:hypothetical protein